MSDTTTHLIGGFFRNPDKRHATIWSVDVKILIMNNSFVKNIFSVVLSIILFTSFAIPALAQTTNDWIDGSPPPSQYHTARILEITDSTTQPDYLDELGYDQQTSKKVRLLLLSGDHKGEEIETEVSIVSGQDTIKEGKIVVVEEIYRVDGTTLYLIGDDYRVNTLWIVFGIFVLLLVIFAGIRGVTSLIGLIFSILILTCFTIPQIVAGQSPLLISIISAFAIALISIYLSHGFRQRTTIAVISTCITITIAIGMAYLFTLMTKLTGMGSEEAFQLSVWGPLSSIDFRGLLLGGIIIGALGVLDDVTTTQSATIDEISKANKSLSYKELYKRGISVGREHITSLVNTLALAYVGTSLPLLLIFIANPRPIWAIINSQMISEEIIRTLVGSIALVLAVPITTVMAAYWFSAKTTKNK